MNLNELENNPAMLRQLGKSIATSFNMQNDRVGFYRTDQGMKTVTGLALMVIDKIKESLDNAPECAISGSHETKDSI